MRNEVDGNGDADVDGLVESGGGGVSWGGFGCKGDSLEGLVTRFIRGGQGPT